MKRRFLLLFALLSTASFAADAGAASRAVNELAVDLQRKLATDTKANVCFSPYAIQTALAMVYLGADGDTRTEMARALHYPEGDGIHDSLAALRDGLTEVMVRSAGYANDAKARGGSFSPTTIELASRLYAQRGYDFREPFLKMLANNYGAPLLPLDFATEPEAARKEINSWIEEQTRGRIRDLLQAGFPNDRTRLAVVTTLYFKAPWLKEFRKEDTQDAPFHIGGGNVADIPTMHTGRRIGYAKRDGYTAVSLPYFGGGIHFLILVPDDVNGLASLEAKLSAEMLEENAKLEPREMKLSLPKFKIESPPLPLAAYLKRIGMKSAFDEPHGSANFDRAAPRRTDDPLYLSEVTHKGFIAIDEKGTEAAAATAVVFFKDNPKEPEKPVEVKVDRPFLFAIQHAPSGACLFLGRVVDPR